MCSAHASIQMSPGLNQFATRTTLSTTAAVPLPDGDWTIGIWDNNFQGDGGVLISGAIDLAYVPLGKDFPQQGRYMVGGKDAAGNLFGSGPKIMQDVIEGTLPVGYPGRVTGKFTPRLHIIRRNAGKSEYLVAEAGHAPVLVSSETRTFGATTGGISLANINGYGDLYDAALEGLFVANVSVSDKDIALMAAGQKPSTVASLAGNLRVYFPMETAVLGSSANPTVLPNLGSETGVSLNRNGPVAMYSDGAMLRGAVTENNTPAEVTEPTNVVTLNSFQPFQIIRHLNGFADIQFTGFDYGTGTADLQIRFVDVEHATSTAWQTLVTGSAGGGAAIQATIPVPKGYWKTIEVKRVNSAGGAGDSSRANRTWSRWAVGEVVVVWGDSIQGQVHRTDRANVVAPNGFTAKYPSPYATPNTIAGDTNPLSSNMWNLLRGTGMGGGSQGENEIANNLSEASQCCVGITVSWAGATRLALWNGRLGSTNYDNSKALCLANGGLNKPNVITWVGNLASANAADDFYADLNLFKTKLDTDFGAGTWQLLLAPVPVMYDGSGGSPGGMHILRDACQRWVRDNPQFGKFAGVSLDHLTTDGVHPTADGWNIMGPRWGNAAAYLRNQVDYADPRGGEITRFYRSAGKLNVEVQLYAGTSLGLKNPAANISGLTLSSDNFATTIPISTAQLINSNTFQITPVSALPAGTLKLRYLYGKPGASGTTLASMGVDNMLYVNAGPANVIAVQPIWGTSANNWSLTEQTGATPPTITTGTLPDGATDTVYNQTLAASGGATPYTWSVDSGSLPAGLTLSGAGVISGTPTTAGTSSFTIRVSGSDSASSTTSFNLTITDSTPSPTDNTLYWDPNGASPNTGTASTGAWNGVNAFWNTASSGSGGTLQAVTANTHDLVFSSGTNFTAASAITISGAVLAKSLTFQQAGAVTLSGTGITLGTGGVNFSNGAGANTISAPITLAAAQSITNSDDSVQTISGGVTGAYNLALKAESTGGLTVSTGAVNNAGAISNTGGSTGPTLISASLGSSVTGVTQNSSTSPLTLSGANSSYAGPVTLATGTLKLGSATALGGNGSATGSGGALSIAAGTTLDTSATTTLSTVNPQHWNGDFTYGGTFALNTGTGAISLGNTAATTRTVTVNGANALTVGGVISDGSGGTNNLTKSGPGTLILGTANAYTGTTTILQGTLSTLSTNGLGTGNTTSILLGDTAAVANNARLTLGMSTTSTLARKVIVQAGNTGTAAIGGSASAVTVTLSGTVTLGSTLNGVPTGHSLSLVNGSNSALTISGKISDPSPGSTTSPGQVIVNGVSGQVYISNTTNDFVGGVILASGSLGFVDGTGSFLGTGTFVINGGNLVGVNWKNVSLTSIAGMVWNRDFSYGQATGSSTMNLGTAPVKLGDGNQVAGSTRTVTVNANGILTVGGVISNSTSGSLVNSLNKEGPSTAGSSGTLVLGGASTYTGSTTITKGKLQLSTGNDRLPITTTLIVRGTNTAANTAGQFDLNTRNQTVAGLSGAIVTGAPGLVYNGGATDSTLTVNNATAMQYDGRIIAAGNTGKLALIKNGAGTLTLTGSHTFSGGTTVNAGTLVARGGTSNLATVTRTGNLASSNVNRVENMTITSLPTTDGLTVGQSVTNANLPAGTVISAILSSTSVALSNFTQNTSAVTGTSFVFGAYNGKTLGSGNVQINGGTLSVTGGIGGNLTVESGARLTLTMASTPAAQTPLQVAGALLLKSGHILNLSAATAPAAGVYTLATSTDGVSYTPGTVQFSNGAGVVSVSGNNLIITVSSSGSAAYAESEAALVSYAVASNNTVPSQPTGTLEDGVLTYTKNAEAMANGDVDYAIELSEDLVEWHPVVTHYAPNDSPTISYEFPPDVPQQYARLVVTPSTPSPSEPQ